MHTILGGPLDACCQAGSRVGTGEIEDVTPWARRASRREEAARRPDYCVVEPGEALWALEDDEDEEGERIKLLMVTLPKPPLTEEEILWKKGRRSGPGRSVRC